MSPGFRRDYWTRHADEPDATVLWGGIKSELSRWLAGDTSMVMGALTTSGTLTVTSRSVFNRSQTLRDLWYYGYFYTLPNFRRLGIGERVLREGLAEIGKLGARFCSCYVAQENRASAELATKLGFHKLPFVRVVIPSGDSSSMDVDHPVSAEISNDTKVIGTDILIQKVIGGQEGGAILADELIIHRPWLPWKHADGRLINLEYKKASIGVARVSSHKAVLLPDPDVLFSSPAGLFFSVVSKMTKCANNVPFISAFVPHHLADVLCKLGHKEECSVYDIFWKDELQSLGN